MDVNDLINALKNGENVEAENTFNGLMADKINTAMDARKIELGQGMMNPTQEEELEADSAEDADEVETDEVGETENEDVFDDTSDEQPE
jgi:hypothetical protein